MLNVAVRAAIEAGKIQARAFGNRKNLSISAKSSGDFVTEVDQACEQVIIETLSKAYPNHRFLGEENGTQGNKESEYEWIIDPLDGTTNFIHGIDQFAVSIACKKVNICYMPWSTIHAEISYLQQLKAKELSLTAPESVPLLPQS